MEPIRLKELRSIHKMTQQELADELNVSQQTISRYENGTHYPDIPALVEIADYFNVPVDYLLGRRWPCRPLDDVYLSTTETNEADVCEDDSGAAAGSEYDVKSLLTAYRASEEMSASVLWLDPLSDESRTQLMRMYELMAKEDNNK